MKKQFSLFILCMFALAGAGGVLVGCSSDSKEASAAETPVEVEAPQEENKIEAFGNVEASTISEVHVDFPATIKTIYVKEGDEVKNGDKIVNLDYENYKSEILKQEQEIQLLQVELNGVYAGLDTKTAELSQKQNELSTKQAALSNETDPEIKAAKEKMNYAEKQLEIAKKDYNLTKELVDSGNAANSELEAKGLEVEELENNIKQLQLEIERLKKDKQLDIQQIQTSIQTMQSAVSGDKEIKNTSAEQLQVKIQMAQTELSKMKAKLNQSYLKENDIIVDRKGGIIYEIKANEGQVLHSDENETILRIADKDSLVATVNVPEAFISQIKVGSRAEITLTAQPDAPIEGEVTRISGRTTEINGENMVKVDIAFKGSTEGIKVGYEVDAMIYY